MGEQEGKGNYLRGVLGFRDSEQWGGSGIEEPCYHAIAMGRSQRNRGRTKVGAMMGIVITMIQLYKYKKEELKSRLES